MQSVLAIGSIMLIASWAKTQKSLCWDGKYREKCTGNHCSNTEIGLWEVEDHQRGKPELICREKTENGSEELEDALSSERKAQVTYERGLYYTNLHTQQFLELKLEGIKTKDCQLKSTKNTYNAQSRRRLYANIDWTQAKYYDTSNAVVVGTKLYYITRGVDGLFIDEFNTLTSTWRYLPQYAWLTDADGWDAEMRYATIRAASVGSKLYVFGRGGTGTYLSQLDTSTDTWTLMPTFAFLRDSDGFTLPEFYKTVRMVSSGSVLYITCRGNNQINIASFDTSTNSWTLRPVLNQFVNDATWSQYMYYATFRLAVDSANRLWLFCRGPSGINLVPYDTGTNTWGSLVTYVFFEDASSWFYPYYYETIDIVPYSTRIHILARGSCCVYQYYYNTITSTFTAGAILSSFPDSGGWYIAQYYMTLRYTFCNNAVYIDGRGAGAIYSSKYIFNAWYGVTAALNQFTDADRWNSVSYYKSIRCVCIGTQLYYVGRKGAGVQLGIYNTATDSWTSAPEFFNPCHDFCKYCSGSLSTSCTQCFPLSHLQSASPSACVCDSHYFPDPAPYSCSPCHVLCAECSGSSSSQCTQCPVNAALTSTAPADCKCVSSYFLETNNVCTACHPRCKECATIGINQCTQCKSNSHLLSSPLSECTCDSGFYFDASNVCTGCHARCKECSGSGINQCTDCNSNSHLAVSPISQCVCDSGFFFDVSDICLTCHQSCIECDGGLLNECSQCKSNAALTTPPTSDCQCNSGYYMDASWNCQVCSSPCATCTSSGTLQCTQCITNAHLITPPTSACECNNGYVYDSNSCVLCDAVCLTCSGVGINMCTSCKSNAHLQSPPTSTCICDSGFFMSASNVCSGCFVSCLTCIGSGQGDCLSCKGNLILADPPSPCICPSHYYPISVDSCGACHETCDLCSGTSIIQCTQCKSNSSLQVDGSCVCDSKYYWNKQSSSCEECHPSCIECNGSGQSNCLKCFPNAFMTNTTPGLCQCNPGFYPLSDNVANCQPCPSLCSVCSQSDKCEKCSENATIISDGVCGCVSGYFYDSGSNICKMCPNECASCISYSQCSTCKSHFLLLKNQCVGNCPSGYVESRLQCVPEPPVPSLSVDTDNILTLTFSRKISKEVENSDIELSVPDLDGTSIPLSWAISTVDSFHSYSISLVFYEKTPPGNSTLYLLFLDPSAFYDENGTPISARTLNVTLYSFSKDTVASSISPMNTPAATTASAVAQGGVASAAAISIISGNPTGLFGLLNQLQLITYIPLMDLHLPDDLFYTLIGLNANGFSINPFDTVFQSERKATQPKANAKNYGFTSTLFLKNSGFIVFSLFTLTFAYLSVSLLSIAKFVPVVSIYFTEIKQKFQWGIPMRLWIQLYLDVGLNSLLQFSTASDFDYQWDLLLNALISALLLSFCAITPIFVTYFIFSNRKVMLDRSDSAMNKKWGVFYMEFKEQSSDGALLYYALFLIRRFLYATVLVLLWNYSVLQMTVNVLFSLVWDGTSEFNADRSLDLLGFQHHVSIPFPTQISTAIEAISCLQSRNFRRNSRQRGAFNGQVSSHSEATDKAIPADRDSSQGTQFY